MFNRGNTKSIIMKIGIIGAGTLLAYSTILENIIQSNLEIQREMNNAAAEGYCTKEEVEKLYNKSVGALQEADGIYQEIQKELDLKMKSDLGIKFGIRKSQSIIKEFDAFVRMKNNQETTKQEKSLESLDAVPFDPSEDEPSVCNTTMEIVKNDSTESE